MIDFNRAPYVGKEVEYMQQAIAGAKLCGDGPFTKKCSAFMKEHFHSKNVLLTTSCTHALEMAAFLCDLQPGDEVIDGGRVCTAGRKDRVCRRASGDDEH